jgi:hypothetical protein
MFGFALAPAFSWLILAALPLGLGGGAVDAGLWGGNYLFKTRGLNPASAAAWGSLFYASLSLGRFLTGFITNKVSNKNLIRAGCLVILSGVSLMLFHLSLPFTLSSFLLPKKSTKPCIRSIPASELHVRHFVVTHVVGVIDNNLRCWYYIQHESS